MPRFVVSEKTTYKMRENLMSLSQESYTIQDSDGRDAFKVKGAHVTLHQRKTLETARGDKLYYLTQPAVELGLRDSHFISDCDSGDVLFTLKKRGLVMGRNCLSVWRGKGDGGREAYTVGGNFLKKNYNIKDASGEIVGDVHKKKFSMTGLVTGADVYSVSVMARQDAALVVAIGVIIDEIYHDEDETDKNEGD